MRAVLFVILICIGSGTILSSCGKRTVNLDRSMRRMIESEAAAEIVILRMELDSLCDLRFDSLVQVAVDSIMEKRQLEIAQIISHEVE